MGVCVEQGRTGWLAVLSAFTRQHTVYTALRAHLLPSNNKSTKTSRHLSLLKGTKATFKGVVGELLLEGDL